MKELKHVFEEFTHLFQELTAMGKIKILAARNKRVGEVEYCIVREQEIVMKLKSLERERTRVLDELGLLEKSYSEILELMKPQEREEIRPIFVQLSREVQLFQAIQENAYSIIQLNIQDMSQKLDNKHFDTQFLNEYTGAGVSW